MVFKPTFSRLRIPHDFVRWFGEIPSNIIVTTNTGYYWRMTTVREGDDAYIDQGWVAFAVDHQLQIGQFLVFKKVSTFQYNVVIFDYTCTEVMTMCRYHGDATSRPPARRAHPSAAALVPPPRVLLLTPRRRHRAFLPNPSVVAVPRARVVMSSLSNASNPFASDASDDFSFPNPATLREVHITDHIPVKLSFADKNHHAWRTYFYLLFREYNLRDHIDGSVDLFARRDPDWLAIDATIICWLFLTISSDIFKMVVREGDDAHTVWTKINRLFTDNKLQRIVFLQQEFFGTPQNDQTLDAYCLRLKAISDELHDLGFKIGDEILLSTLTAGLNEDLGNAASNLTLMTEPTFERAVTYLKLEERRLKNLRTRAVHTTFAAGYHAPAPPAPAPPQQVSRP
ncbi:hypothetical protein QYE76_039886 [Lolium multiflorum]|uniref:TF-B3 domain-containing protein n=1 Tax=Lolium multiflorum TaxID=4521 RepID=A0AAD8WUX8_LOLMU|nr:hypothetical protein QYE76_039886 [Lolium multiflorum]